MCYKLKRELLDIKEKEDGAENKHVQQPYCDSTYPDVLFMRWRRTDGKEKHTNVNGYISIQRKAWSKTSASFQMCKSSDMG